MSIYISNLIKCSKNYFPYLNIDKSKVMRFYRSCHPMTINYKICDTILEYVVFVNDLDTIFKDELNFVKHLGSIVVKVFRLFSFVIRHFDLICDKRTIKLIYNCIVHSVL